MTLQQRILRPVWGNPVVTRDLRVRMRGSKSYWYLAVYLLLLGILAIAGYAAATGGQTSAVIVQGQLTQFYSFIFYTLATVVCFVGPALTAASITSERQNLTLDLLLSAPLAAPELLVGKLVSSVAFLSLILVLSLPASALCVMLGGSTMGDVFRDYVLLATDGLLLAAVGLYASCSIKNGLAALIWTYAVVAVFLLYSSGLAAVAAATGSMTQKANPLSCFAALNPFTANIVGRGAFRLAGLDIPVWLGTAVVALLLIRLLATAATYRLSAYGGNPAGSVRRQILFFTATLMFAGMASLPTMAGATAGASIAAIELPIITVFLVSSVLLPSLFVPVSPDDAARGVSCDGGYDIRRAFRPEHAGALPFFHIWLATVAAAVFCGGAVSGVLHAADWKIGILTVFYVSGLGFLSWSIARRAAGVAPGITAGRFLSFAAQTLIGFAPIMLAGLTADFEDVMKSGPISWMWVLRPLMHLEPREAPAALAIGGLVCYGLGLLIYPAWKPAAVAEKRSPVRVHTG